MRLLLWMNNICRIRVCLNNYKEVTAGCLWGLQLMLVCWHSCSLLTAAGSSWWSFILFKLFKRYSPWFQQCLCRTTKSHIFQPAHCGCPPQLILMEEDSKFTASREKKLQGILTDRWHVCRRLSSCLFNICQDFWINYFTTIQEQIILQLIFSSL